MVNFYNMSYEEINREIERYQMQLIKQQEVDKIPLTEAQKRRWYALSKAYRKINVDHAK